MDAKRRVMCSTILLWHDCPRSRLKINPGKEEATYWRIFLELLKVLARMVYPLTTDLSCCSGKPVCSYSRNTSCTFLSSLQPKNVVWRNWSSAVNSAYSTSHTSLGRTH